MASFAIGGLSTGIDFYDLINDIMEVERVPIDILEEKKSDYSSKISAYGDLTSKLSTLKSAADKLRTNNNFYVKSVSVTDDTVLDATVTGSAAAGNYAVTVNSLASEEKEVKTTGETASTSVINNTGSDNSFQYTYGGTQTTLTVADGTTLEGLRDLINDDTNNPGVTATIINDGSTYRLSLTGNSTGASNSITIDGGTTLSGYGSADFSETKTASDSSFIVDGVTITRSSNSISDVITGVTFDLFKGAGSTSTISVTADKETIKDQINAFVDAYNDVATFIDTFTDYDANDGEGASLTGESSIRSIESSLQNSMSGTFAGGPADMIILSQMGITTNSETGLLEIDDSVLDAKITDDIDDVANFFTDTSGGLAVEIYDYIETITDTVDGSITLREDGLQDLIDDIDDSIEDKEYRLEKTENDLIRKFTALEMLINEMQNNANALSMLDALA